MKIGIIGAGITGLTTAFELAKKGHDITVYEASPVPGGLGTYVEVEGNYMERFYHHFFESDVHVMDLIRELGIQDKLHFYPSKTSVFYKNKLYPFSSPLDLLRFSPLPMRDRIKLGTALAMLKYLPVDIQALDRVAAKDWLITYAGKNAYDVIWEPLLIGKFEKYGDAIPAAWLRERVRDRTFKLGYLDGGISTLVGALLEKLKAIGVKVHLAMPVTAVQGSKTGVEVTVNEKKVGFDKCLLTTVSPITAMLLKNELPKDLKESLTTQDQLGAVCLLLELDRQVQENYWVNICDLAQPVLVAVEHTNMIPASHYGNRHLIYLANYTHRDRPEFKREDKEIMRTYTSFLKKLNPAFKQSWILKATVSRVPRAQTIFGLNSFKTRPPVRLLPNIYMGNIDQMYPHDRNFNLGVELGRKIADLMNS